MDEPQYKAQRSEDIDAAAIPGLHTSDGTDPQHDSNAHASWAAQTLQAYRAIVGGDDDETLISDLLGDLMHLCDALRDEDAAALDFDSLVAKAEWHYEAEIRGEF